MSQNTQYPFHREIMAVSMADDITYRILFYKSDGTFVNSTN